jgi:DNA-binding NarL/FixJ family response regulator
LSTALDADAAALAAHAAALISVNAPQARGFAERALLRATAEGDAATELAALRQLGQACHLSGDLRAAIDAFSRALPLAHRRGDTEVQMICANGLAASLSCVGDLDGALVHFLAALALARTLQRAPLVAKALNNIGFVYEGFGDDARALAYYRAAYREKRRLDQPIGVALMNVACILDRQGVADARPAGRRARLRAARRLYSAALSRLQAQGDRENESHALANLALAVRRLGDRRSANTLAQSAIDIAERFGLARQKARALSRLGEIHALNADPVAAREAFSRALALADAAGFAREMRAAVHGLQQAQVALGERVGAAASARRLQSLDAEVARVRASPHLESLSLRADVERLTQDLQRTRERARQMAGENRRLAQTNARLRDGMRPAVSAGATTAPLSPREREVLTLLVAGLTNEQIGAQLGMSKNTARTHVVSIFGKLKVRSRSQAVACALMTERGSTMAD